MNLRDFLKKHKVEILIFALALLARLVLFFVNAHAADWDFDKSIHGQDGYYEVARNIDEGKGFSIDGTRPSPIHVPVFPYFLASSLFLFDSLIPAALLLIVIGSAVPILGRRLALKLVGSQRISLFVGVALALEPSFLLFSTIFYTEILFIFIFLSFILVFIEYIERKTSLLAFVSGAVLGIAALTKVAVEFLPILLIPFAWLSLRKSLSGRDLAKHAALFLLAFFAVLSPWMIRNDRVFGAPGLTVLPT
ncbi:MAG: glycosyltransferase family 39 protein, partial [Candidatus Paceibacterota bacterium]